MKKLVILFLILCFIGTLNVIDEVKAVGSFSDIDSTNNYFDAVTYLHNEGIIKGNADGTFRPYNTLNRAEFVTIITRSEHLDTGGCSMNTNIFPDVGRDQWFAPYVCYAYKNGLVNGYPDGTFHPTDPISFVEAAKILTPTYLKEYNDYPTTPWFEGPVEYLESQSAIPTSISSFDKKISRGEMAEILYRVRTSGYRNKYELPNPSTRTYEEIANLSDPTQQYVNSPYEFSFQFPDDLKAYQVMNERTDPFKNVGFSSTAEPMEVDTFVFYMTPNDKPAATELFRIFAVSTDQQDLFEMNMTNTDYGMGESAPVLLDQTSSYLFYLDNQSTVGSQGVYTSTFRRSTWGYNRILSLIQDTFYVPGSLKGLEF